MIAQIPSDLQEFVRFAVSSGAYKTEGDVLTEALTLLREREQLRQEIAAGIDQLDRGEVVHGDVLFAELRQRAAALAGES